MFNVFFIFKICLNMFALVCAHMYKVYLVSDLFFRPYSECLFHEDIEYIGIWIYYGVWICS